ncbi:ABC transporter permease [Patescibacteria group bacterium]|nr:ABC transporter permease [Patescibacteria group bacterium]MBU4023271.1 ABC transporter permease [Patescibacteria group bacterium]MBU4078372.1 ABC transporter permease [Patescibacteria group bacterium]
MFTYIRRIIRFGWQSFLREGSLNLATIFVIIVTISLFTFLFASQGIVEHLIDGIKDKIDISVYLNPESSQDEIIDARDRLSELPAVKSVTFLSNDEVLEEFRKRHVNDPVILESLEVVGSNPFYASLNIRAQNTNEYASILTLLNSATFEDVVYKVDYLEKKTVIDKLSAFIDNINSVGLVSAIILAIVSVLVAFNTIRVAIYDASREISIMRLVGSPNKFIRGPFIVQGIINGTIAAIASCLLFLLVVNILDARINDMTNGFDLKQWWVSNLSMIIVIQLASGIALGSVSSLIAIRKYLKV